MDNRDKMIVKAAMFFYKENKNQTEIAQLLGISRPTVATFLKEAVERGIVKISIQDAEIMNFGQQEAIAQKYGLKTVLISSVSGTANEIKQALGNLCVSFIESNLGNINKLGIGWGTTLFQFVEAANYRNFEHLSIIPLIGGVDVSDVKTHSNHLAFVLSQKYNCKVDYFYAPAIAESLEMKQTFEKSKFISDIIEKGKTVDMAIVSIGNPIESSSYRELGYFSKKDCEEISEKHIIGDLLTTFFDEEGKPVDLNISKRMLGVNLEDLKKINNLVVVASGKEKAKGIQQLLKQNVIDHLIIDTSIASVLL